MKRISDRGKYIVDAVIFDLDGTLIDSKEAYFEILNEAFKPLGLKAPPREKILEMVRAKEGEELRGMFLEKVLGLDPAMAGEVGARMKELFPKLFRETVSLIPGADMLLWKLREMGIKVGLVTSTHVKSLKSKMYPLERAGMADLFGSVLCIEDVEKCKPDPSPLIKCARELDVPASRSMYVGDSRIDIKAGNAAGMITVGVLTGMDDYRELEDEGATMILSSVKDLLKIVCSDKIPLKVRGIIS